MADKKESKAVEKRSIFSNAWFWIAVVAIILWLVSLGGNDKSSTYESKSSTKPSGTQQATEPEKPKGKVEVKSESVKDEGGSFKYVVGEVENKTGGSVTAVKVTATFYDKDGKVVDTNYTYAGETTETPLENEQTTPFDILTQTRDFDHYKLDVTWR